MIILLATLIFASEPNDVVNEPLSVQDEIFIDNLDKELLEESVKDLPKFKLDAFSEPGEYKFNKGGNNDT